MEVFLILIGIMFVCFLVMMFFFVLGTYLLDRRRE
jgi:hypothetical protein